MNLPSLTNALRFFSAAFDGGRTSLGGQASALFGTLVILEVVIAGVYLALGTGTELKAIARKILAIGFLSWVIQHYSEVLRWVVDGFLLAGQTAGSGSNIDFASLQDPDRIFMRGLELCRPAVNKLFADWNASYFGIPSVDSIMLIICVTISVLSYGLMAIQVFITYLEYLLITAAGFILLPFGVFKPTSFLAERVFGAIISFGIKLMVLALIIGVSDKFLATIAIPDSVSWQQSFEFVIISLALAFLTFHAPGVALSLLSGTPHLTAGTIIATGAGAAIATGRLADAASAPVMGTAKGALAAAGAMHGGATARMGSIGDVSGQPTTAAKMARIGSKGALGAAGMVEGAVSAAASAAYERVAFGKTGSPSGRKAAQSEDGKNPSQGGLIGMYNAGRFSVPQYRTHMEKKRKTKVDAPEEKTPPPDSGNSPKPKTA